jgi:glycosyltransferase involved in cell wall biosynthesis
MDRLRRWDLQACSRVDRFVAISHHVAGRIKRNYGKDAVVLYPPVDVQRFSISEKDEGFYLVVSALAPYKRVELAIEACNRTKRALKVIGTGQHHQRIRKLAGPTVELLGWQPDEVIAKYYELCKAVIFPGEEDFGIVPLEAMACGKPVIAYAKGGALETVVPVNVAVPRRHSAEAFGMPPVAADAKSATGVFFYEQTPDAVIDALELFERYQDRFHPEPIRRHVQPFDVKYFKQRFHNLVVMIQEQHRTKKSC